jgi:hypothetical protein
MQCGGMFVLSTTIQTESRGDFRLVISETHDLTWHVSMDNLGSSSVLRQEQIYSEELRRVHIVRSRGPQRNCMHLPYHVGNHSCRHRHRHRHRPYYQFHPKPNQKHERLRVEVRSEKDTPVRATLTYDTLDNHQRSISAYEFAIKSQNVIRIVMLESSGGTSPGQFSRNKTNLKTTGFIRFSNVPPIVRVNGFLDWIGKITIWTFQNYS